MSVHRIKKKNPLKQNCVEDPLRVTFGAISFKYGVAPPSVLWMVVARLRLNGLSENGREWTENGVFRCVRDAMGVVWNVGFEWNESVAM